MQAVLRWAWLVLMAMIVRYGAQLEHRNGAKQFAEGNKADQARLAEKTTVPRLLYLRQYKHAVPLLRKPK